MSIYFNCIKSKLPWTEVHWTGRYCTLNLTAHCVIVYFFPFYFVTSFFCSVKLMTCIFLCSLWDLCNSEHSHICQVCVPLLLHCITLPSGSDMFWKVIQDEFHNTDWRYRFIAGMCNTESDLWYYYLLYVVMNNYKDYCCAQM
jgi:hypothetical protein